MSRSSPSIHVDEPAPRPTFRRDLAFQDAASELDIDSVLGKMACFGEQRELSLYNGVSNRSRGWKSRNLDDGRAAHLAHLRKWDGAARMSYDWNQLRRVGVPVVLNWAVGELPF